MDKAQSTEGFIHLPHALSGPYGKYHTIWIRSGSTIRVTVVIIFLNHNCEQNVNSNFG